MRRAWDNDGRDDSAAALRYLVISWAALSSLVLIVTLVSFVVNTGKLISEAIYFLPDLPGLTIGFLGGSTAAFLASIFLLSAKRPADFRGRAPSAWTLPPLIGAFASLVVFVPGAWFWFPAAPDSSSVAERIAQMTPSTVAARLLFFLMVAAVGVAAAAAWDRWGRRERMQGVDDEGPQIFISYRRTQASGWARSMFEALVQEFRAERVFMDVDGIEGGDDFSRVLKDKVSKCDVLLAVIDAEWLAVTDSAGQKRLFGLSDFVRQEIGLALACEKRVIPIFVDGATMPLASELPEELAELTKRNGHSLRASAFRDDMARLIHSLKRGRIERA